MLRTVLFWVHLVAGVLAGALIVVMSATGVALTYERQVRQWADLRALAPVTVRGPAPLATDSLVTLATAAHGGSGPTAVTRFADPAAPVQFAFGREGLLFLEPTTGAVLGSGSKPAHEFFETMEQWHRWLGGKDEQRVLFKSVNDAANLLFLVIVLTGMVLWLPKTFTWVRVRAVLWFRRGLSGKARDFNWHNVLGIWSALPLVAIVASGTVISYPWAVDLVYKAMGEAPPPRRGPGGPGGPPGMAMGGGARAADSTPATPRVPLDSAFALAAPSLPGYRTMTIQLPKPGAKTINVSVDRGWGGQPQHRVTVQVFAESGQVKSVDTFGGESRGFRARAILRFLHTGEVLGLVGQTIAGLVSLASVVLVVTGIALAVRRASRALARRGGRVSVAAAD